MSHSFSLDTNTIKSLQPVIHNVTFELITAKYLPSPVAAPLSTSQIRRTRSRRAYFHRPSNNSIKTSPMTRWYDSENTRCYEKKTARNEKLLDGDKDPNTWYQTTQFPWVISTMNSKLWLSAPPTSSRKMTLNREIRLTRLSRCSKTVLATFTSKLESSLELLRMSKGHSRLKGYLCSLYHKRVSFTG
jgi:hypothetical protein